MKYQCYLAGAMSCYGVDDAPAREWRDEGADWFADYSLHFYALNPMDFFNIHNQAHQSDMEVMKFDLRQVKDSRAVLVNLMDLDKSLGTSDEIMYAWLHDIPVIGFLEDETLVDTIHSWKLCQMDRVEIGSDALERACEYIDFYYG